MAEQPELSPDRWRWVRAHRNVIAFWFLGLANNYGYVVMLSAAHDILSIFDKEERPAYKRECNTMSTGIILLADIMPSILVKIASPFLPLAIRIRMTATILLSAAGFLMVALQSHRWMVLLGVVCTSLSCGLGESSLLSYLVFFSGTDVLSTWSSGTGGAGVAGSMSYAGLTTLGLSPSATILLMLCVPALQTVCFFVFLRHPRTEKSADKEIEMSDLPPGADLLSFRQSLRAIPALLVTYMLPFGLVYLFEYSINQGLFELLYFPQSFLSHSEQYRWYSVLYQIGVFVSRSSMKLLRFDNIWLLAGLQFVNVGLCFSEVLYGYMTFLPVVMAVVFWEGLVGGASYVNTYRRIATETAPEERQFCMAMNSFADVLMITCAGLIAYPTHSIICTHFPSPYQSSS